jgi:hypothetical protein
LQSLDLEYQHQPCQGTLLDHAGGVGNSTTAFAAETMRVPPADTRARGRGVPLNFPGTPTPYVINLRFYFAGEPQYLAMPDPFETYEERPRWWKW